MQTQIHISKQCVLLCIAKSKTLHLDGLAYPECACMSNTLRYPPSSTCTEYPGSPDAVHTPVSILYSQQTRLPQDRLSTYRDLKVLRGWQKGVDLWSIYCKICLTCDFNTNNRVAKSNVSNHVCPSAILSIVGGYLDRAMVPFTLLSAHCIALVPFKGQRTYS